MDELKVQSLIFSPTGSTKKIVYTIEAATGLPRLESIDLTHPREREAFTGRVEGDLLIVGSPVYEGSLPWPIVEPLKQLNGKGKYGKTLTENATVQIIFYTEQGKKLWSSMKKRGLEGVIAKKKDSTYQEGKRSDCWMKIKFTQTVDAIVVGFTKTRRKISSLALGLYDDGDITYIGKVGTGFDDALIERFWPQLEKIKTTKPRVVLPKEIIAVKPRFVAEVRYLEFTPDRKLRAPVFKRLRDDKEISECRFPE